MLRLNQMNDQFTNMEKSFFYEYEDLYENIEINKRENRDRKDPKPKVRDPFFI